MADRNKFESINYMMTLSVNKYVARTPNAQIR